MKRKITSLLAGLLLATAMASCTGDTSGGPVDENNCPNGQQINPVSGECEPDGSNNNNPDAGPTTDGETTGDADDAQDPDDLEQWEDQDDDGVPNTLDNCAFDSNPDQLDTDGDGVGDACDNCVNASNQDQADSNGDGTGDACSDEDDLYDASKDHDNDGTPTVDDNCPETPNDDQADADGDSLGDACDNCPNVANYDQVDTSGNGTGDACEPQPSGDICAEQESEFVEVNPNIYIVLDKSGSMGNGRMGQAKDALDTMADQLASDVNFGMLVYPGGSGSECTAAGDEILDMGSHSASAVKGSYAGVNPGGSTPTGGALAQVQLNDLYSTPGDSLDDVRPKVVVLITDGDPNASSCGYSDDQDHAVAMAQDLANENVPVHVIGYEGGSPSNLNEMAVAGGTGSFIRVNNSSQLVTELQQISEDVISCSYTLNEAPQDPGKIWVEINGSPVARNGANGFEYDAGSNSITLKGTSCDTLKNTPPGAPTPLKISLGCATECEPTGEEVCDYIDNNCDGVIDEGCGDCSPEVCDGVDNNCNEEVDEGCPECAFSGETCASNADCCIGRCNDEGVCEPPCRPTGVSCEENSECCSGACAGGADGAKTCIQG